jgi:hypothetical protein
MRPGYISRILIWSVGFTTGLTYVSHWAIIPLVILWAVYINRPVKWDGISHKDATVKVSHTKGDHNA